MIELKNRIVFITGASSGIGEACAAAFAAHGAHLILAARRTDRLIKTAEKLKIEYNITCFTGKLDVRDPDQVRNFIDDLPEELRRIDILINNAGLARGMESLQEGDIPDWNEMIDTNIKGLLFVTRTVLPGMIERGSGHIINIGSIAGRQVYSKGSVYCATKFAVRALNQGMLIDLVDTPVRVSSVDPGRTKTEFSLVRFHGDNANANAVYDGYHPLQAEDIAEAVIFCATRPPHANVTEMVILPSDQASAYHSHQKDDDVSL